MAEEKNAILHRRNVDVSNKRGALSYCVPGPFNQFGGGLLYLLGEQGIRACIVVPH